MGSGVSLQLLLRLTVRIAKLQRSVILANVNGVLAEVIQNLFADIVILKTRRALRLDLRRAVAVTYRTNPTPRLIP